MRFDFDRAGFLMVGKLVVTWDSWFRSEAHPLIDGGWTKVTPPEETGKPAFSAGGIAVRLAPRPTSERTRCLLVAWEGARVYRPRGWRRRLRAWWRPPVPGISVMGVADNGVGRAPQEQSLANPPNPS